MKKSVPAKFAGRALEWQGPLAKVDSEGVSMKTLQLRPFAERLSTAQTGDVAEDVAVNCGGEPATIFDTTPSVVSNELKITKVLTSAKCKVADGTQAFRGAAEDMAAAQDLGASQRRIADAVGMSVGWVNTLLKWREFGYPGVSPFQSARRVSKSVQRTEHDLQKATGSSDHVDDLPIIALDPSNASDCQNNAADSADAMESITHPIAENELVSKDTAAEHQEIGNFSNEAREALIEALGMLRCPRRNFRAALALRIEERRARTGLTWHQLFVPAGRVEP